MTRKEAGALSSLPASFRLLLESLTFLVDRRRCRRRCRLLAPCLLTALLQHLGGTQSTHHRTSPALLAFVLAVGLARRRPGRRQPDVPLGQPHQRLLPAQFPLQAFVLPLQSGQLLVGAAPRSARPRFATGHQRLHGPRLDLEVSRLRHPQSLGRLAWRSYSSQDLEDRRRQSLGLVSGILAQPGSARRVPQPRRLRRRPCRCCRMRRLLYPIAARRAHAPPPAVGGAGGVGDPSSRGCHDGASASSKGDVPGRRSSSWYSSTSPLTSPAGQTGSGSCDDALSPATARSTSCRVPSGPVTMTRSPSA